MAVEIPVQTIHRGEILVLPNSPNWPTDGYVFDNDGETFIVVRTENVTGNLTVYTTRQVDGKDAANLVLNMPVYTFRLLGTFPVLDYNDENGQVKVTFSNPGGYTWMAAYKLTSP
jgi:hypothetical protein